MHPQSKTPWIGSAIRNPDAAVRLLCFPYAGAGAVLYQRWPSALPHLDVCAIELPGRFGRTRERIPGSILELLDRLLHEAEWLLCEKPIALFGYSFGAVLAFELAHRIQQSGFTLHSLSVAARRAPQCPARRTKLSALPSADFLDQLQREYGAIDAALLADEDMRNYIVNVMRGDLRMLENYEYQQRPPLNCPVFSHGGTHDASTSEAELLAWREHTTAEFEVAMYDGGHFFIRDYQSELLKTLARQLPDQATHDRS